MSLKRGSNKPAEPMTWSVVTLVFQFFQSDASGALHVTAYLARSLKKGVESAARFVYHAQV